MLTLKHEPGSLYTTLAKFTAQSLNLTKLESRPIEGSDFDARFYFDFEASPDEDRVKQLLDDLERTCDSLTFLGGYTEKY
jgi:chorismate mutase/prephenate dehydratase